MNWPNYNLLSQCVSLSHTYKFVLIQLKVQKVKITVNFRDCTILIN